MTGVCEKLVCHQLSKLDLNNEMEREKLSLSCCSSTYLSFSCNSCGLAELGSPVKLLSFVWRWAIDSVLWIALTLKMTSGAITQTMISYSKALDDRDNLNVTQLCTGTWAGFACGIWAMWHCNVVHRCFLILDISEIHSRHKTREASYLGRGLMKLLQKFCICFW